MSLRKRLSDLEHATSEAETRALENMTKEELEAFLLDQEEFDPKMSAWLAGLPADELRAVAENRLHPPSETERMERITALLTKAGRPGASEDVRRRAAEVQAILERARKRRDAEPKEGPRG